MSRWLAECIGTFMLVFAGVGAIVSGQAGLVGVALAHGLAITVMVSALGRFSGGHFNPAVSLALLGFSMKGLRRFVWYVSAQLVGATAASFAITHFYAPELWQAAYLGAPLLNGISAQQGFWIEALLTFFLVLVVYGTAVDIETNSPKVPGLFIGLTITLGILVGGPLTGAAMNPARAFGPAFAAWSLNASYQPWLHQAVYWLGPLTGGLTARFVWFVIKDLSIIKEE